MESECQNVSFIGTLGKFVTSLIVRFELINILTGVTCAKATDEYYHTAKFYHLKDKRKNIKITQIDKTGLTKTATTLSFLETLRYITNF